MFYLIEDMEEKLSNTNKKVNLTVINDGYLTKEQTLSYLKIGSKKLERFEEKGLIQCITIDERTLRYRLSDIHKLMDHFRI